MHIIARSHFKTKLATEYNWLISRTSDPLLDSKTVQLSWEENSVTMTIFIDQFKPPQGMFFLVFVAIFGEGTNSEVHHCVTVSPASPLLRSGFFFRPPSIIFFRRTERPSFTLICTERLNSYYFR
jgi:hypothetical protein